MATDFTNNNTTISASGALQPKTRNTPLDIRTRVNLKADIESIPNPFVGMHIIVLQDETNDNQMTEYVVTSLKANNLGVADSKINEVVLAKDFLGVSSTNGSGMTSEQVQQLNAAYTHSQSAHVQQSDLPTKTSQLTNDSGFITEHQDISGKADKSEIPTKTSQLTNDSNFISSIPSEYVTETKLNEKGYLTEIPSEYITESELNAKGYLTEHQDISGKADKSEIPTKTSQLENDSNFATESFVSNKIAEAQLQQGEVDLSGYQTKEDDTLETTNKTIVGAINEVNTNIMSKANKSDIPTKTSQLTNDSNFLTSVPSEYVTETELESKGYLTEHQSLEDYALKTELPTKTSQLTNDSGYLTEHQNISGKADKSYVDTELAKKSDKTHAHSYNDLSDKPAIPSVDGLATKKELTDGLATKSDTGHTHDQYLTEHQDLSDYALKSEIPTVPTKTSQLTNDSNFISSIPEEYVTEQELNSKGLATETFVTNKIAEASLSGGEVDLSGLGADLSLNGQTLKLKNSSGQEIGTGVTVSTSSITDEEIDTVLSTVFGDNSYYEIQDTSLSFGDNETSIQLSSDVQDCTCNISYTSQTTVTISETTIPSFTNLYPYLPLSEAPNLPQGIQRYKGAVEFIGNNKVKFTANVEDDEGIFKSQIDSTTLPLTDGHKYYLRVYQSIDNVNWEVIHRVVDIADGSSYVVLTVFRFSNVTYGTSVYVKNPLLVDLTEMYGVGNEPTQDAMLTNIPEDIWTDSTYTPGEEGGGETPSPTQSFTITSKNTSGETIDTYESTSDDKTIDIVSGGTLEITGDKPTDLLFTNVKIRVLAEGGSSSTVTTSTKKVINLHNVDRLLFIGDSYTEGMYYQRGKAWVCQLAEQLDYTCESYGWGGYTCATLADNIKNNLTRYNSVPVRELNATRALLMSFVNDMAQGGTNSSIFQSNMEKLIKTVYNMGCKPIVCTEFRDVWEIGLQIALKGLAQQYNCEFWNILPYTTFLGCTTASDNTAYNGFYAGSHPGQRTGGIIFNNYLKYAQNLPRPTSALKIYRLRNGISVSNVNDLIYDNRRDKLLKFKEINIAHSALQNATDWDSLGNTTGSTAQAVNSEYGKLMKNENVSFGDYALVECVLPSLKGNIKSVKLNLSASGVTMYVKEKDAFTLVTDTITDFSKCLEYDKITFLLYKQGGFNLNDVYVQWEGNEVVKSNIIRNNVAIKGTELLTKNTMDDMSWFTVNGNVVASDPTNYTQMPTGCTKLITIDNSNYVSFNVNKPTSVLGTTNRIKLRVICRYNPTISDSNINENSYDRKQLLLNIKGQYSASISGNSQYTLKHELDMSWTLCEFEMELNENTTFTILSSDTTPIEVCYISILEI